MSMLTNCTNTRNWPKGCFGIAPINSKPGLGWDVHVNDRGEERDQYDDLNPIYVIWEEPDGSHGGSMRVLPTTGPVMVNDVFGHLTGGEPINSPLIWEVTRFCLSRTASPHTAGAIMLSGGEMMEGFGLTHIAGVFDARMIRIYRLIGSSPIVLGTQGKGARPNLGWSLALFGRRLQSCGRACGHPARAVPPLVQNGVWRWSAASVCDVSMTT